MYASLCRPLRVLGDSDDVSNVFSAETRSANTNTANVLTSGYSQNNVFLGWFTSSRSHSGNSGMDENGSLADDYLVEFGMVDCVSIACLVFT